MNEGSSTGPWEWFKQGFELAKTQKHLAEPLIKKEPGGLGFKVWG